MPRFSQSLAVSNKIISPDLVIGPHADPLGNLPVLLSLLGEGLLDLEGLVGRLSCRVGMNFSNASRTRRQLHERLEGNGPVCDAMLYSQAYHE